jgi:sugar phosphate isomerase/epimerase
LIQAWSVRLSVITDEIDPGLAHALGVCEEFELDAVELRTLDGRQIVDHSEAELEAVRAELGRRGFAVCAIASPFLKCDRGEDQDAVLERTLRAAAVLEAPVVRAFGYWRESDPAASLPDLGRALRDATTRAHAAGLTLALENEHECNVATAAEARAALAAADVSQLRLIWDPGNAAMLDPAAWNGLGGLETIVDRVVHVHLKDVTPAAAWTRIGDGIVDFRAQLSCLSDAGYDGYLSFETHYVRDGSGELATRECIAALRALA